MAIHTRIERDGEDRQINWGWWHVERMQEVAILETEDVTAQYGDDGFFHLFPDTELDRMGRQTVKGDHHFLDESDGEKFSLLAGDVMHMTFGR